MTPAPEGADRHDALSPNAVLVRARDVVVRLGDADFVQILHGDKRVETTPNALLVLHAFAHPRKVAEVLGAAATGPEHWIELSSTVVQLARVGILRAPGDEAAAPEGFAKPTIHVVMLDDEARTGGYLAALRARVQPDDIVIDIGTGTGVLAASAVRAGAARVYAIESSAIADAAACVFATNDLGDRARLVRGRSTEIALPERGNLLVTEIIGNDPLDERILEVVADAKERLLVPGARVIPQVLDIFALLVDVPAPFLGRHVFTPERLAEWQTRYGLDFSSLASIRPASTQPIAVETRELLEWSRVAPVVPLRTIDLEGSFERTFEVRERVVLDHDVERLGVVLAFRATLAPNIAVSTLPDQVSHASSWRYGLWPALDRPRAARGDTITIDYSYFRSKTSIVTT